MIVDINEDLSIHYHSAIYTYMHRIFALLRNLPNIGKRQVLLRFTGLHTLGKQYSFHYYKKTASPCLSNTKLYEHYTLEFT